MEENEKSIHNPDGDFHIGQNYLLQLCADGVLSPNDFVLYCFYRSMYGARDEDDSLTIKFDYLSLNTGLSHSTIQRSLHHLADAKVLSYTRDGVNGYKVVLVPNNELPRRKLYPSKTKESSTIEIKEEGSPKAQNDNASFQED